nr:TPA_asm: NADH dehydrogenase subunit 5 [Pseudomyrmex gracilis]
MYSMLMYTLFMFLISLCFLMMSVVFKMMMVGISLEWLIYSFKSFNLMYYVLLDWVSMQFIGVVLLISSMVMMYSTIYMEGDKTLMRFYMLVILFILSMVFMILSPNVVSILLGWDGLGLVSYCLVIYYNNYSSYNSGMVTVLSNRVGDVGLLMCIGIMVSYGGWSVFVLDNNLLVMMMIFIAAVTKSAQIPFSYWLPQAMAAPTPVSSLVHSSTLVTAGVYLLIRFNELLMMTWFSDLLYIISLLTMFMAGFMANFEFDLKKIIALSTLSQLGLMMMILSVGYKYVSFFHLEVHAIFKSLLFLCAGSMIHLMSNNQDIRFYGKMNEFIPFIMMSFYISSISLCGAPFMAGFYSKDLIMEILYFKSLNLLVMFMSVISLCFTVSYTVRLLYYIYFGSINFYFSWFMFTSSWGMNLSMFILLMMSVIFGSLISWVTFFDFTYVYLNVLIKLITLSACLMGVAIGLIMYFYNFLKFYLFVYFISSMWMMMFFFNYIYKPFMPYWYKSLEFDKIWVEFSFKSMVWDILESFKIIKIKLLSLFMFSYISIIYLIVVINI